MIKEQRRRCAVILAAGDGKRMKSERPKAVCEVLFKPMLRWVEDACRAAGIDEIYIVAGEREELLRAAVTPECHFFRQTERLGTGHAARMAGDAYKAGGDVIILFGDAPMISPEVINGSYELHRKEDAVVTVVTAEVDDPSGYGRVTRGQDGRVERIVEQADASPEQKKISEINSGVCWYDAKFLASALDELTTGNAQGEYYLTGVMDAAIARGERVETFVCENGDVALGANSRRALQKLCGIARERVLERQLDAGVDIPLEDGIIIGIDVEIGADTRILPGTVLEGAVKIGRGCVIGPNSYIKNSTVGDESHILASYLTDSTVGDRTTIGPFTQLRPNSHIGNGVKIGDFVEIKNSTIGDETSIAHLTYIGDSDVGKLCNFGCGVVTANYDGQKKYRCTIDDRAFVGCNTNLISPVHIGEGAYTAAGTTVVGEVPAGALAIGRARQEIREGWSEEHIHFKK